MRSRAEPWFLGSSSRRTRAMTSSTIAGVRMSSIAPMTARSMMSMGNLTADRLAVVVGATGAAQLGSGFSTREDEGPMRILWSHLVDERTACYHPRQYLPEI